MAKETKRIRLKVTINDQLKKGDVITIPLIQASKLIKHGEAEVFVPNAKKQQASD